MSCIDVHYTDVSWEFFLIFFYKTVKGYLLLFSCLVDVII